MKQFLTLILFSVLLICIVTADNNKKSKSSNSNNSNERNELSQHESKLNNSNHDNNNNNNNNNNNKKKINNNNNKDHVELSENLNKPNSNNGKNNQNNNKNNKNKNKGKHSGWKPKPHKNHPKPVKGFSGWKSPKWGKGPHIYNENGEKHRRKCHRKYNEYMKVIYDDYEENDILSPEELNGREIASPKEFPHVAAIGIELSDKTIDWKCGGSLIDKYYVVTAAHCGAFGGDPPTHVKIGDISLKKEEKNVRPQQIKIEKVINFYNYTESSLYNDISLLKLTNPVEFTRFVRPIRLWSLEDIEYDIAFAMGYGSTQFGRQPTNVLTYFNLTLIGHDECENILPDVDGADDGVIDSQVCALDKILHRDTCQGDSGGPLQLNLPGKKRPIYYLIGITSYGLYCGSDAPGVYTRITSYLDWIEDIVWPDED